MTLNISCTEAQLNGPAGRRLSSCAAHLSLVCFLPTTCKMHGASDKTTWKWRASVMMIGYVLFGCFVSRVDAYRCPGPEWRPRRGSTTCYLFSHLTDTPQLNYADARDSCRQRGGSLLEMLNTSDVEYITSRMGKVPAYESVQYWTGLSFELGDRWTWMASHTSYSPGSLADFDPNTEENFVGSRSKSNFRGVVLHHADGSTALGVALAKTGTSSFPKAHYICQATYSSRPLCRSEEGWDYVGGRCWKSMYDLVDWNHAAGACQSLGGYLAVPQSDVESSRALTSARLLEADVAWLGLNLTKSPSTVSAEVTWSDGSSLLTSSYTAFWHNVNLTRRINEMSSGEQYCGSVEASRWNFDGRCAELRPYVCESELERCPYGWSHFDGLCYSFQLADAQRATFLQADRSCRVDNGHLVVIYGEHVQNYLEQHLRTMGSPRSTNSWIGYESRSGPRPDSWRWVVDVNGSSPVSAPVSYTNWQGGRVPASPTARCALLQGAGGNDTASGQWMAGNCEERIGYICQVSPANALPQDIVHPHLTCHANFTLFHDACFYVSREAANWHAADRTCRQMNATLVEIHTSGENAFVLDEITENAWIGINRFPYVDESGRAAFFNQYATGQNLTSLSFDNFAMITAPHAGSYCAFMHARPSSDDDWAVLVMSGLWDYDVCVTEKRFVCQQRGEVLTSAEDDEDEETLGLFDADKCGAGWLFMEGGSSSCYKFNFQRLTHDFASQVCQNHDATSTLLHIASPHENTQLRELLAGRTAYVDSQLSASDAYWTSLHIVARDNWHWQYRNSPASPWLLAMALTNWAPGQPDAEMSYSKGSPKCGTIRAADTQWASSLCTDYRPSICKKPAKLPTTPQFPTDLPPPTFNYTYVCPPGWKTVEDECFLRVTNTSNWQAASLACRQLEYGAHLASLTSPAQHRALHSLVRGAWIGMNSLASPHSPRVFLNDDPNTTLTLYTPWADQIPFPARPYPTDASCVASLDLANPSASRLITIDQYSCADQRPFVCQVGQHAEQLKPDQCIVPPRDEGCRSWGYGFDASCFYMGNTLAASGLREMHDFDGARRFCSRHYGGDLAVINDADTQQFATVLLTQWNDDYWVGLRESPGSSEWSALTQWVDGQNVTFTSWAPDQPGAMRADGGCVALHGSRDEARLPGAWYVSDCRTLKFPMCQSPREGYTTPLPVAATTAAVTNYSCPSQWTASSRVTSLICYKAFASAAGSRGSTWQEAQDSCAAYGGHLASITSAAEQAVVAALIGSYPSGGNNFWIGLSRDDDSDVWTWSDGSPYGTNTFFTPPTNPTTSDHAGVRVCVAVEPSSGTWIAQNCQLTEGWVCGVGGGPYAPGDTLPTIHPTSPLSSTSTVTTSSTVFSTQSGPDSTSTNSSRPPWTGPRAPPPAGINGPQLAATCVGVLVVVCAVMGVVFVWMRKRVGPGVFAKSSPVSYRAGVPVDQIPVINEEDVSYS